MNKPQFNPRKYIIENGRKLPIHQCLISDGYEKGGLTLCMLIRKQPSGKFTIAHLMLDRFCLGLKNCFTNCNLEKHELDEIISKMKSNGKVVEKDPVYFHNLVYAAIDYGAENGFKPHKDFDMVEKVLDPDFIDDGIDEIEMGKDGMPLFIQGPYDDVDKIMNTLNRQVGEGNFHFFSVV